MQNTVEITVRGKLAVCLLLGRFKDENLSAVLLQPSMSFYKQLEGRDWSCADRGGDRGGESKNNKSEIVSLTTIATNTSQN